MITKLKIVFFTFLNLATVILCAQDKVVLIKNDAIFLDEKRIGKIEVTEPTFENFNKYLIQLTFFEAIEVSTLEIVENEAKSHFSNKFKEKPRKIDVITVKWNESGAIIDNKSERINAFNDYIYQRLEAEDLAPLEGVYESIESGNEYEYSVVILKSIKDKGTFDAYLLMSTDPELPVSGTLFKLRPTAVPNKYLTQYWLNNGFTTSNQLTIFDEGILNAGPKSYIKMYPRPNETRKYFEVNPLVDWEACGSGVLLGPKGIVATNYHVVNGAKRVRVKIMDFDRALEYDAVLIAHDMESDIALLRVSDTTGYFSNFRAVSMEGDVFLGQEVMTLGYPIPDRMGENVKFNKGYVSALSGNNNKKGYF